ncbi:MAG: glycosyltransferase [Vicinamibacterales bacterium]
MSIGTAAERRGAFRACLGIASDAPLVLFLSRVDQKKGLDLLIQGFALLRAKVPKAVLVIAGNGSPAFVSSLRALAASTGLSDDAIVWAGFVEGEAKREAFADADVFALPSYSENFGIAVAEAMAAGLPVVVSDRVGIHDDVVAAGAGYVVSCQASEIADALSALLANREMARVMGQQGAILVRRRYSDEAVTAQVMAAYRHVLDSTRPSSVSQSRLGAIQGHA